MNAAVSASGASSEAPGSDLAILVNANAKRGGRRVAAQITRHLPGADVRLTHTPEEIDTWLASLSSPRCIFAAGGDGTAVALINALNRTTPADKPLPLIGLLPLGTGNAWSHVTGARKLGIAIEILRNLPKKLPWRRFGLVECEGVLSHFAGSGWDAEIVEDYKRQVALAGGLSTRLTKSAYGYITSALLRTTPKTIAAGRPHVVIENLGDEAFTIAASGRLVKLSNQHPGAVLYEGISSVSGAATCPEFGARFRAYPFAERLPGFINLRLYNQSAIQAVLFAPTMWRGAHPLRGMHDWFVRAARFTFSRPVAVQIAGDAWGLRKTIEYRCSPRTVDILDWKRLDAAA